MTDVIGMNLTSVIRWWCGVLFQYLMSDVYPVCGSYITLYILPDNLLVDIKD